MNTRVLASKVLPATAATLLFLASSMVSRSAGAAEAAPAPAAGKSWYLSVGGAYGAERYPASLSERLGTTSAVWKGPLPASLYGLDLGVYFRVGDRWVVGPALDVLVGGATDPLGTVFGTAALGGGGMWFLSDGPGRGFLLRAFLGYARQTTTLDNFRVNGVSQRKEILDQGLAYGLGGGYAFAPGKGLSLVLQATIQGASTAGGTYLAPGGSLGLLW